MEHIITRRRGFRKLLVFLLCMASILGFFRLRLLPCLSDRQQAPGWAISM